MQSLIRRLVPFVLALAALLTTSAGAAGDATATRPVLDSAQLEVLIGRLEDDQRREELIATLRGLAQAAGPSDAQAESASVRTAAADALELVASRVAGVAGSLDALANSLQALPRTVMQWADGLRDPETRQRWLYLAGRLVIVLGSGFLAAAATAWLIRRQRSRRDAGDRPGLVVRILRLTGRMIVDLVPVLVFAAVAYAVLAATAVPRETRLVAVTLINASILSRLILAMTAFLLAPDARPLRLWRIADETAHYLQHWVRRLSFVSIYGFFVLQALLLLGLDKDSYRLLLHLLGALLLGLLLVLVAQNREDVARGIAEERGADSDEPVQLMPLRRALARVWHLVAGLYLVTVYVIWVMQVEDGARFVLQATVVSLGVLGATVLISRAVNRAFERGLRLSADLRSGFPELEQRLNRYFPVLRKLMKTLLAGLAGLLIADAWGVDALGWLIEGGGRPLLGALVNILVIIAVAVLLWEMAGGAIERYLAADTSDGQARSARTRTLLTVGRNALLVVLALVSTLMVLAELGINIAPLLAGAGVVGLAIGFGAQRLVQDVINGVFILFQDLMSVGDVVRLGDKAGVVEALSIRTVRLRDLAGVVHTIPFSAIEGVSNLTREFSFHVFDIGIAYREDVDGVIELIKQIGEELRADPEIGPLILEPVEVFGLDAFGDSAIVIKGRIKTRPIKQWQVGRAFNRLVKIRFDERGIEIPFPHRTLYFGQDKDGSAPPAFVQLESLMRAAAADAAC